MDFANWLNEGSKGSKYTKGSWKQQVQAFIDDFNGKDVKSLQKVLDTFTKHELTNLIRNAFGFKKYNRKPELNDFLDTLMQTASKTLENLPEPKPEVPKVSNKDWSDFEKLLKTHDVYYQMSDDRRVYQKGKAHHDKITAKYRTLSQVDKKRADKLMKIIRQS